MKKILILIFIGLFSLPAFSQDDLVHSSTSYVDDFANIFSAGAKQEMDSLIRGFKNKTEIEFSIVSVKSLNGRDIEGFTIDLARKWGVGSKANQGVMILVAPNEHLIRTEVGYGLEGDLPDIYVTEQQDKITPYFKQGDFDKGVLALLQTYIKHLDPTAVAQRKIAEAKKAEIEKQQWEKIKSGFLNFLLFASIIGLIVFFVIKYRQNKKRKQDELEKAKKDYEYALNYYYKLIREEKEIKDIFGGSSQQIYSAPSVKWTTKTYNVETVKLNNLNSELYSQIQPGKKALDVLEERNRIEKNLNNMISNLEADVDDIKKREEKVNNFPDFGIFNFDLTNIQKKINELKQTSFIQNPKLNEITALQESLNNFSFSYKNLTNQLLSFKEVLNKREKDISTAIVAQPTLEKKSKEYKTQYSEFSKDSDYLIFTAALAYFLKETKDISNLKTKLDCYLKVMQKMKSATNKFDQIIQQREDEERRKREEKEEEEEEERRRREEDDSSSSFSSFGSRSYDDSDSNSSFNSGFSGGSFEGAGGTSGW